MSADVKNKGTQVTQEEFELAHMLKERGVATGQIEKILERSSGTIWTLLKAETFKDYKALIRKAGEKQKAKEAKEVVAEVPVQPTEPRHHTDIVNLTEAVITLTAVMNRLADGNVTTNSFWRKK